MFVGMRDVVLHRMGLNDPYGFLRRHEVGALEVRVQMDLSLDAFVPRPELKLRIGSKEENGRALEAAQAAGMRIRGILLNTRYHDSNIDLEAEKHWISASADFAAAAGIGVIRVDLYWGRPVPPDDQTAGEYIESVTPRFEAHLRIAQEKGIRLAVENHAALTNRREYLLRVLERFARYNLGVTLDTGNFYCTGGHPLSQVYALLREFASRTVQVHVKNIAYPPEAREVAGHHGCPYAQCSCPIPSGDVDHAQVVRLLQAAGYAEGLYIEDESLPRFPKEQQVENLSRTVGYLQGLIAAVPRASCP